RNEEAVKVKSRRSDRRLGRDNFCRADLGRLAGWQALLVSLVVEWSKLRRGQSFIGDLPEGAANLWRLVIGWKSLARGGGLRLTQVPSAPEAHAPKFRAC
ncbi:hypothetical protein BaRGS_00022918, partial [Batillaria attramentaria]